MQCPGMRIQLSWRAMLRVQIDSTSALVLAWRELERSQVPLEFRPAACDFGSAVCEVWPRLPQRVLPQSCLRMR